MRIVLAVFLAFVTATLYALSTSLQSIEAKRTPRSSALRASLIGTLARRRLWLAGTAAGVVAWPMQAAALALGSVALVQPALGFGLIVLLVLGVTVLHEHVGAYEIGGALAVAVAVGLLGWAAPGQTGSFTTAGSYVVAAGLVASAALPHLLRAARRGGGLATSVAAGCGWAAVGLGTSLIDVSIADRHWPAALAWAIGVAAAGWGTLLAEMTSLQEWPATRAIPVAFGLEMLLPAILAPALTHGTIPQPVAFAVALVLACTGAVVLGRSRAVAKAVTA